MQLDALNASCPEQVQPQDQGRGAGPPSSRILDEREVTHRGRCATACNIVPPTFCCLRCRFDVNTPTDRGGVFQGEIPGGREWSGGCRRLCRRAGQRRLGMLSIHCAEPCSAIVLSCPVRASDGHVFRQWRRQRRSLTELLRVGPKPKEKMGGLQSSGMRTCIRQRLRSRCGPPDPPLGRQPSAGFLAQPRVPMRNVL
jgi:hypothetical protein